MLATVACGARTLAIEPDPGTAESLRKNIALNKAEASVRVAETAVGEYRGSIRFTVGLDTMNKVSTEGTDTSSRVGPLTTLDSLFDGENPVMLKLDVEGFEGAVLRGAARLLGNPAFVLPGQNQGVTPNTSKHPKQTLIPSYINNLIKIFIRFLDLRATGAGKSGVWQQNLSESHPRRIVDILSQSGTTQ